MKHLILMRHAKSDWSGPGVPDVERPLNARGNTAARALGNWLRAARLEPDQVLCSSATRTRQTLQGLALALETPVIFRRDLYLAEPDEMILALRSAVGDCVLMIGHNPGVAYLARAVVSNRPDHAEFPRCPTGATLVAEFDIKDWAAFQMHSGTTIDFVVPRDLMP